MVRSRPVHSSCGTCYDSNGNECEEILYSHRTCAVTAQTRCSSASNMTDRSLLQPGHGNAFLLPYLKKKKRSLTDAYKLGYNPEK